MAATGKQNAVWFVEHLSQCFEAGAVVCLPFVAVA